MLRSPVEQLAAVLADTGQLVEAIRDDQWDQPTLCTEWSVRDLVDHLVAGNYLFARALLGDSPQAAESGAELRPGQRAAAYQASAAALLAAFGAPGVMHRIVTVPFGSVPGFVALHLRMVEALVHGWDLAKATGQAPLGDEELAEQEMEFTRSRMADVPPDRSPFGPAQPVAEDAPALHRLVACLGRDVHGRAAR